MRHRNVGGLDRAARLVLGAVLLAGGVYQMTGGLGHGLTLTILGSHVLISAIVGFCPPYALVGFSTARPKMCARSSTQGQAEGS